MAIPLHITLTARLQPMHRGELFEDALEQTFAAHRAPVELTGGGTSMGPDGEPLTCDIEVDLPDPDDGGPSTEQLLALVVDTLREHGAPVGSTYRLGDGEPIEFGIAEGIALYLNGTDLPAEVYATSDVNDIVAAIEEGIGPHGAMFSYWEGPRETALYLYGDSAATLRELAEAAVAPFPLARQCRWEVIAAR